MPGISEPGDPLITSAIEQGITVIPVPGPAAVTTLLSVSGLPTDKFIFEGFLPRKSGQRKKRLEELKDEERTMVFYESPHRLQDMLEEAKEIFGDRKVCVGRELTKKYEEILYLSLAEAIIHFTKRAPKGEFTLVIAGAK
jgi:16S rRNA (cytidine1402-2'-O)-methyltransferase